MNQPLISVIVPVYKAEAYIHQCVDSILNQTYKNLEIILIDDGSPCRCPEICDSYALQDDRVFVIHQENRGLSVARNQALEVIRGEYVAFVDSDDWIEETAYEDMLKMMLEHTLDVVFCTANIIVDGKIVERRFEYFEDGTILPPKKLVELSLTDEIGGQVWYKLWHRRCWEKVRFPEGRIYEDLAISFRPFLYAVHNVGFLKRALYNYRLNSEGISLSPNSQRMYHIFLAFAEHYEYAKEHAKSVESHCLLRAIHTAAVTYNRYIVALDSWDEDAVKKTKQWLKEHRKQIMSHKKIGTMKKFSLWLLIRVEVVYKFAYSVYHMLSVRVRRSHE